MDLSFNPKVLPRDAWWQDLIPQLKCPQCQIYQACNLSSLERHVILHCKCRPALLKYHYIRKLKHVSAQTEEDVLDYVRLTLEAKLLQWRKEGMPEIPLLLRYSENQSNDHQEQNHSKLLDLWRLWHQEIDCLCLEFNSSDLIQLMTEAEGLNWELNCDTLSPVKQDNQFNLDLMSEVTEKLKEISSVSKDEFSEELDVDFSSIEKLEREGIRLSLRSSLVSNPQ